MAQAIYHNFPNSQAEYSFICRSGEKFDNQVLKYLEREINRWEDVYIENKDQVDFLLSLGLSEDFVSFLEHFHLRPKKDVSIKANDGQLEIKVKGPWLSTIWYEIPVLFTVNQLYFDFQSLLGWMAACGPLNKKIELLKDYPINLIDFGTRRRRSKDIQRKVISVLTKVPGFAGTSNVSFAKEFGIPAIGTMAHEWICAGQALFHPLDSQKKMLEIWQQEFNGRFGIALSDTLGTSKFVKDFSGALAMSYAGVRQDSGNPLEWLDSILKMYADIGVDPRTKTAVFSDGLTITAAQEIEKQVAGRIKTAYGIGTHLTNDIPGLKPMNIVMKLVRLNGRPVAKLSDVPTKAVCEDKEYLSWLRTSV
jgi:nicotinate phosphoribosyltransferase